MLYWLLEDPDLPRIGVWSLEHESDKTLWGAQGSMKRAELLPGILEKMRTEMFSDRASPAAMPRQLCWIAHSEGGNVVKAFLQHCQLQRSGNSRRSQVAHSILEATQAVYSLTPPIVAAGWLGVSCMSTSVLLHGCASYEKRILVFAN